MVRFGAIAAGSLVAFISAPGCGRSSPSAAGTSASAATATATAAATAMATPSSPAVSAAVQPPRRRQVAMRARYACDEKYEGETPCTPHSDAFQRWLSSLDLDKGENLLELDGGGPVGGQWNPGAPLVVFVPALLDGGEPSVRVGHHGLRPATTLGDHVVYYVPRSTWESSARRPRRDELTEVDQAQRAAVSVTDIVCKYSDGRTIQRLFVWANGE